MEKAMTDKGDVTTKEDVELTLGSMRSKFYTPTVRLVDSPTNSVASSSSSPYHSSRIDSLKESKDEYDTTIEFEIAASTSHWTEVDSDDDDTKYSPEDDLKHFETLKLDYRLWGSYRHYIFDNHNLRVGKKIGEGGQAEIYEAKSNLPLYRGKRLVVKVFKEGYSLQSLQRMWPPQMVAHWTKPYGAFGVSRIAIPFSIAKPYAIDLDNIKGVILLKDERFHNRFAFVMERAWGDLRKHIDCRMLNRTNNQGPPYSIEQVTFLMFQIALHMTQLQEHGILHQDLKAANVLVHSDSALQYVHIKAVADFECSKGVVGTGFWRAPEILQQLKNGVSTSNMTFTTKADVFSYGMMCYEIVIGCIPFEGVSWQNYDHVLSGKQPTLPYDLDPLVKDIITNCWQLDPCKRPSFSSIFDQLNHKRKVYSWPLLHSRPHKLHMHARK